MQNIRPDFDHVITDICQYVYQHEIHSDLAYKTAYHVLIDSIACGLLALNNQHCHRVLGPVVPGATLTPGARVFGTNFELDPVQAAFNNGALIRWLDFNDTWLAQEWGHPSDNLGAILAVMDYLEQTGQRTFTVKELLTAIIKAEEIQGVLALENSFNRVGLDHVVLVKVASTAVASFALGLTFEQACNAVSLAWVDGQSLRTYRHSPNTGSRKSWAAGDATSRAVRLALLAQQGETGYPSALSAPTWGFYDVSFHGNPFTIQRPYDSYVVENILFKISFPAEFHAQTAVEAAFQLHPHVKDRLDEIDSISLRTQEAGMRIISKQGPLHNPADRDHCLEYMVAIGLLFGELSAEHYEDNIATDPRIDALREKMSAKEDPAFTKAYFDPEKRAIPNAIQVHFKDGTSTEDVCVHYPVGHRVRREEGIPLLLNKYRKAVSAHYDEVQTERLLSLTEDDERLLYSSFSELMSCLVKA